MVFPVVVAIIFTAVLFAVAAKFSADSPDGAQLRGKSFALCASAAFAAGLLLRFFLGIYSKGFSVDIGTFKAWAEITNEVGFSRIYKQDIFIDYPPGYLYILVLLEKIRLLFGLDSASAAFTFIIKLPAILSDMVCALTLLHLSAKKLGEKQALLISCAYIFCPAVFINSAQWGQADSFCTMLLMLSLLLLYGMDRGEKVSLDVGKLHVGLHPLFLAGASGLIFGAAVISKPQMLAFVPVYLFFMIKRADVKGLVVGICSALTAFFLIALPFTQGFDFVWLFEKYVSTMNYYSYYSVNAFNFWSLIMKNWVPISGGAADTVLELLGPVLATVLCGVLMLKSKRKDSLFAGAAVIMTVVYLFGLKVHERYLFPALLCILLTYVFTRDRRLFFSFGWLSLTHYLNVRYVLYLYNDKNGEFNPNTVLIAVLSAMQLAAAGYMLYVFYRIYIKDSVKTKTEYTVRTFTEEKVDSRMTRLDAALMLGVTLIYGLVAFWNLGLRSTAVTPWTPDSGESVVIKADGEFDTIEYIAGIAPDTDHYNARVDTNLTVEISDDGVNFQPAGEMPQTYVFTWSEYAMGLSGQYVRLTSPSSEIAVNEVGLRLGHGEYRKLEIIEGGEAALSLVDEQETVPQYTTYENSMYFDEIYHARTAYEHMLGLEPLEYTHPPLGKYIISLGIMIFGMNPFGWRFMGTLFGVLMLPCLYYLLKLLVGKSYLCFAGTAMFAFDFMHFTQTRIATIDTYSVLFLILMYSAMTAFIKKDITKESMKRLLPPLLLAGLFTGLGIASKWTAAYGAAGLAVLFFGKLFVTYMNKSTPQQKSWLLKKSLFICLWCILFFIVLPVSLYFVSYLPMCLLPHNAQNVFGNFVNYQVSMFNYHSQLTETHFFASPWYEWPFVIRPIWYFSGNPTGDSEIVSSISAMGNPLLWWSFIPAALFAAYTFIKERSRACAVALTGFISVYLPWVLVSRVTFIYHYFTAVPFLIIALMFSFSRLLEFKMMSHGIRLGKSGVTITRGQIFTAVFLLMNITMFIVFFPVISGATSTHDYVEALEWMPNWYFIN